MKFTKLIEKTYEVEYVSIFINIDKFEEDEFPSDFPFRGRRTWFVIINIETGEIQYWPKGEHYSYDLYLKVVDTGTYRLLDGELKHIASIEENYVPHGVVPGEYGDYIELNIDQNGFITNWKKPTFEDFKTNDDE